MSSHVPASVNSDEISSQEEVRALAEFRYTLRQFLRFSEDAANAAGISPQQHQALLAIRGFGGEEGISVGDLAERLQIRHHSAVGLVDRLVAHGIVVRAAASDDRRKVRLELTGEGQTILSRLSSAHRQELRRVGPTLRELLHRLDQPVAA